MILAIEDALSEAVLQKLVRVYRSDLTVSSVLGGRGNGYLRAKARELNRVAGELPVFLLTDLDTATECPASIVSTWLGMPPQRKMMFRVAVMEVESWLLADRERVTALMGVPDHRVPENTDSIPDPKQFLVNLARRSRSAAIKHDLVPAPGSTARVGPAYNARMTEFVQKTWSPTRALPFSPSLARAIERLRNAPF